jgi:hypothetical protein
MAASSRGGEGGVGGMKFSIAVVMAFVLIGFLAVPAFSKPAAAGGLVPSLAWKEELLGAPSFQGLSEQEVQNLLAGSSGPVVGPNVRVNDPQTLFPAGRLGRSETTIAVAGGGRFLVAGWNDAEGFNRRPFTLPGQLGFQAGKPPGLSGFGFSTNGGATWTDGDVPFTGAVDENFEDCGAIVTRGDPWLDSSDSTASGATIFYANLAVHEFDAAANIPLDPDKCAFEGNQAGVSVHRGGFFQTSSGALSFNWKDVRLLQAIEGVGKSVGFPLDSYDKEALAAKGDLVAVSVTNFVGRGPDIQGCGFGQIELWTSHDRGDSFEGPILVQIDQVSDVPGLAGCFSGRLNQGSQPIIVDDHTVAVVWQNGPDFVNGALRRPLDVKILASTCDLEERSCSTPVIVDSVNSMRLSPPEGYNRNRQNDFPRIAVAQGGPHPGRVFVVYPSGTSRDPRDANVFTASDILLKFSDDRGLTWRGRFQVNPPGDGRKDFWPVASVDAEGNVNVVYYSSNEVNVTPDPTDTECSPDRLGVPGNPRARFAQDGNLSSLVDVVMAQSGDGGKTFGAPVMVTEKTSNWCKARSNIRPNFGDYIDAKSLGETVFIVWADGRLPAPAADTLAPPAGPRDREADVFYGTARGAQGQNGGG